MRTATSLPELAIKNFSSPFGRFGRRASCSASGANCATGTPALWAVARRRQSSEVGSPVLGTLESAAVRYGGESSSSRLLARKLAVIMAPRRTLMRHNTQDVHQPPRARVASKQEGAEGHNDKMGGRGRSTSRSGRFKKLGTTRLGLCAPKYLLHVCSGGYGSLFLRYRSRLVQIYCGSAHMIDGANCRQTEVDDISVRSGRPVRCSST